MADIIQLEDNWKLSLVDIELIDEADENANAMTDDEFQQLVKNIRQGGLSSVVGCMKIGDRYKLFSGHHRVRACKVLRYKKIPVIYKEEADFQGEDEFIATQLSHNSLHGEDDKGILKRLFEKIKNIDFKIFAHINTDDFPKIDVHSVSFGIEKEMFSVSVILYRSQMNELGNILGMVDRELKENDVILLSDGASNEKMFLSLMGEIGKQYKIKSTSVRFSKILELAKKAIDDEGRNNKRNKS
ncbi:MAG: hypothetical protein E7108_01840 [Bacteroidales bacterium]|nr:hypothetical protein [Bacteroidales bacterium]